MVAESNFNPNSEAEFSYGQLLVIVWRRRFWFLATFGMVLVAAGFLTISQKPTYESSMQLLIEPNYQDQEPPTADEPRNTSDGQRDLDYATQLNLMRSEQFIEQATEALRSEYPDLDIEQVQQSFTLSQIVENKTATRIFQVVYTDDDPVKTQRFLQALQDVYQEYNLSQQELRLKYGLAFINEQLETVRGSLSQSQGELKQFRQGENLIDPEVEAQELSNTLTTVRQQQQDLQAQSQDAQDRSIALQQQLRLDPQAALVISRLSQSPQFRNLLSELQLTELELAKQRTIFTDEAVEVQALLDQRQEQITLLQQESQRVLGGSSGQFSVTALLSQGRLSEIDLDLVKQLADAQTTLEGTEGQLRSLAATERRLREEISQFPELIAEYSRLQPETETTQTILQQLLERREKLSAELAGGGFNWQLVEPPQEGEKIAPKPKQNILLGAVAGIFLGGVAAFLRESVDGVVRTSNDLRKQAALPLLGLVPELPASVRSGRLGGRLSFNQHSATTFTELAMQWPPFRESLDLIYKNIQLIHPDDRSQSLVITSALPGEGKSTLILGLALSAARTNQRVLVIDADLRHPRLHERLNLTNVQGFSTLLESNTSQIHPQRVTLLNAGFDVLPAGPEPIDPVRSLNSRRLNELMQLFRERYDLILIDAPPVLGMVDAIQVASVCSGVVMVGRLDRVTQEELRQATAMLESLNVLGIVANGKKDKPVNYGKYAERNGRNGFPVRAS